jgi:hypothetical protein
MNDDEVAKLKEKAAAWDKHCELMAELQDYVGCVRTPGDIMIAEQKRRKTIAELTKENEVLSQKNAELEKMILVTLSPRIKELEAEILRLRNRTQAIEVEHMPFNVLSREARK